MVRNFEPLIIHLSSTGGIYKLFLGESLGLALRHFLTHFLFRITSVAGSSTVLRPVKAPGKTSLPGPVSHCEYKFSPAQISLTCTHLLKAYVVPGSMLGTKAMWVNKWMSKFHLRKIKFMRRHKDSIFFQQ